MSTQTLADAVAALIDAGYVLRPAPTGYGWMQAHEYVAEQWGSERDHAAAMERAFIRAGYLASDGNGGILELQADPAGQRTMENVDLEQAVWLAASAIADENEDE